MGMDGCLKTFVQLEESFSLRCYKCRMIFPAAAKALSLLSCLFASSKISFDMAGFSPFVLAIVSMVFLNVSRSLSSNDCKKPLGLEDGGIKDSQLSADSYKYMWISRLSGTYSLKAKDGRLNNKLAWCGLSPYRDIRPDSYFQVDFSDEVYVSGFATQGFYNLDDYYVKTYKLRYSLDGKNWTYYSSPNKVWTGNHDANSIHRVDFNETIKTRYLRIYPQKYYIHRCLRVEVYGCPIQRPTQNATAQSSLPSTTTKVVSTATVHSLPKVVATPSLPASPKIVATPTTFVLTSTVSTTLTSPTSKPTSLPNVQDCKKPLGLENGDIKDSQLSADSYKSYMWISRLSSTYSLKAKDGRLNNKLAWCGLGPHRHFRPDSYFQVDFNDEVYVSGLATQGFYNLDNYYVKTYKLRYSSDGKNWIDYSSPNKVWTGNHDANSIHRVYFNETVRTRYLRIYPQKYSIYRCLRVEVYGCSIQRPTQNGVRADPGTKSPSRMLILGVCLGIGVLVVIAILAVVVLRTNIRKREGEIGHRILQLDIIVPGEKCIDSYVKREFV